MKNHSYLLKILHANLEQIYATYKDTYYAHINMLKGRRNVIKRTGLVLGFPSLLLLAMTEPSIERIERT